MSSAVDAALCVNPLQRRVRKGLPIMERKAGTASMDEKETLRIAKIMKQNAMITTRRKNSNSGVTHPEKNMLHRVPTTERTSL